jgi:hypothetical protein
MKAYGEVNVYIHTVFYLGTIWRRVVSFAPLPLYPRGKSPRYPLDKRLGGSQGRSGRRREKKILDPTGTRTPTPRSSSQQPVPVLHSVYVYIHINPKNFNCRKEKISQMFHDCTVQTKYEYYQITHTVRYSNFVKIEIFDIWPFQD